VQKAAKFTPRDRSLVEDQLVRLAASSGFQHSEALCQLLRYLVNHALEHPEEHIGEYQIAVEVFGRSASFDPRLDSAVRVQTSRLRSKLSEYYATSGAADVVMIEIPRGAYLPVCHIRTPERPRKDDQPPATDVAEAVVPTNSWRIARPGVMLLSGVLLGAACGYLIWGRGKVAVSLPEAPELRDFWSGALRNTTPPLVVFSNAEFSGRPETGLRYFDPKSAQRESVNDLYTGVGETLAIAELSDMFHALNRTMVVKRSGLLSWDEARNHDLIFAGSPSENQPVSDLLLSQEFVFRAMKPGEERAGDLAIANQHPQPGEPAFFFASPSLPLSEDYAVVTFQDGQSPQQSIVLFAGTTTLGTQGACDFLCQNEKLAQLRKRLPASSGKGFPPFTAVLHIRIARGVPVGSELVLVRTLAHSAR
jgi:hypothetical protein